MEYLLLFVKSLKDFSLHEKVRRNFTATFNLLARGIARVVEARLLSSRFKKKITLKIKGACFYCIPVYWGILHFETCKFNISKNHMIRFRETGTRRENLCILKLEKTTPNAWKTLVLFKCIFLVLEAWIFKVRNFPLALPAR